MAWSGIKWIYIYNGARVAREIFSAGTYYYPSGYSDIYPKS